MKILIYNEGVFFSKWVSKFINKCLQIAKKIKIEKIIYANFFFIKKNLNFAPLFLFFEILEQIKPIVGLKVYTLGVGKTKAIPIFLNIGLQYKKALFWLVSSIIVRKEIKIINKVYGEFYDTLIKKTSETLLKKKKHYKYTIIFKSVKRFK